MKNLSQKSWSLDWNLDQGPLKYRIGVLLAQLQHQILYTISVHHLLYQLSEHF